MTRGTGEGAEKGAENGIVLVNVLVILAIAAGLVLLMLTAQERAVARGRLASNVAQAEALALGAEASVLVALRRDMVEAPEADHLGEAWARSLQQEVRLATGTFRVDVADVNARFDVNRLSERRLTDIRVLTLIAAAAEVPEATATRIAAGLAQDGKVERLSDLARFGATAEEIAALDPYLVALPDDGLVNLNTCGAVVLAALLGNAEAAARLLGTREEEGELTDADLAQAGVIRPPASAFTSNLWDVSVLAEVDGAIVRLASRLLRRASVREREVIVTRRRFGIPDTGRPAMPVDLG